ncbi:extracellular solute-binding protein [Saccharothrix syringae]|uniref:Extracellular solute-binding protein n=1 Tax=Saccharothrix syringae TaxID=103733 RepID=A0A5Q0GTS7_SACSY|nr:extracellular solute-binding protein [Saccharothrix syringae]QFZ17369.1 extracellular solute-binding protein [Saccharothrix syringae]
MGDVVRVLVVLVIVLAACGRPPEVEGYQGRGPIAFADGLDTSAGGQIKELVKQWNAQHGDDEEVTFHEMPASTDAHRAQLTARAQDLAGVDRAEHRARCYDVVTVDVVWTAAFAAAGYLEPVLEKEFPLGSLLPQLVDASRHDGRLWAVPWRADVGLLYYRRDVLEAAGRQPPRTWDELVELATTVAPRYGLAGYLGQFARYEGLTANVAEVVWAHRGDLLRPDEPGARAAVHRLASGFAEGWIPRAALDYQEVASRDAFRAGGALFLRHWPNALPQLNAPGSPVAGRVDFVPLPGPGALGGWNLAVSRCSTHQKTAAEFINFLIGEQNQRALHRSAGFPPTWTALYRERGLERLRDVMTGARARPVSPYYDELTGIIQESLHDALEKPETVDAEVARLAEDLDDARKGR